MNILYIDANIYLGFYNSNRPEYKKLLGSVIELADKIFFTEQIGNEINRNKLSVFRASIENYHKQVNLISTFLPEHLDEDDSAKLTGWNKTRKELEDSISNSNKELTVILNEVLTNISVSQDKVSKALSILYKKSQKPTDGVLQKGRLRKEIGSPPGKKGDPLGDQLSWEQLLTIAPKIKRLWVVTTDKDYFTEHNKDLYLNPVLFDDLKQLQKDIEVKTFNLLSKALEDFNIQEKIKAIPTKEELERISMIEAQNLASLTASSGSIYFPDFSDFGPSVCNSCGSASSIIERGTIMHKSGGFTMLFMCTNCGNSFEKHKL